MVEKTSGECLKLGKRSRSPSESIYEIKNGLRIVKPYDHVFNANTKRRWIGQTLISVFSSEFKAFSTDYYRKAIIEGRIKVNKKIVCPDKFTLKDGDKIEHRTRREETPIVSELPTVVHESDQLIAVNKPSSVPVHPCGNFKENTL